MGGLSRAAAAAGRGAARLVLRFGGYAAVLVLTVAKASVERVAEISSGGPALNPEATRPAKGPADMSVRQQRPFAGSRILASEPKKRPVPGLSRSTFPARPAPITPEAA
jgi:hypothetical protein